MEASKNLQNMKTLDDSWNAQDLETFRRYHAKDCIVRWPNQPPTHGIEAHEQDAIAFFKMFPDQHLVNNPYEIMIAQGEWTCTVADFTGTMKGPMTMPNGTCGPADEQKLQGRFLYGCTLERTGRDIRGEFVLRPDGHAETNRRDTQRRTPKSGIGSN
jgi:hypothetical protein